MKLTTQTMRWCVSILLSGAFFLLISMSAWAQLPTGTILGVVKDSSGAVIPDSNVTIHSTETDLIRRAVTDSSGSYRVPALPVGRYDIKIEHAGFKTLTQTGLNLEVGQEAVLDFALQVGTAEQQVQVTGEAQQVNTTNSTLGTVVSEQTISDLPLNGRNYTDLTLLQPGITQHKDLTNTAGYQPGSVFSSNGAPLQSNSVWLDGASLVNTYAISAASGTGNTLGVDGIREYKVVTNNFSAEYGMTMGSQTVLVSKGGTNSFHGNGFEFLRNSVLDAANYFDKPTLANGFERLPPFRRNNFGGTIGGPVKKDKTFFFAAYEGLRENIGQTIVSGTIPSDCFGQTNNPCATKSSNTVSNPVAFAVLQLFPQPNLPVGCTTKTIAAGTTSQCQATYPSSVPITENWGQGRFDHTFSAADTFFARYTFDDSYFQFGLGYAPFVQVQPTRGQFVTFSENHVFSAALLNTVRFSFSRTSTSINSPSDFGPNFPSLFAGQLAPGLGTYQITGITVQTQAGGLGPTTTNPATASQNIYTWSDDLFWEKGKHSWKFGTLINYYQFDTSSLTNNRGAFTATDLPTFLAGTVSSIKYQTYPVPADNRHHNRYDTFGVYAQDDYKVLPRLTLNLGLRYEFATVIEDRDGLNASGTPTCTYPCSQVGPNYTNPYLHNFSPRIGFAWDVFGNGKTSLRGGAALLYDVATLGNAFLNGVGKVPPFGINIGLSTTTLAKPIDLSKANTAAESNPTGGIAHNLQAPRMYQWNLTIERQLPFNAALQVSYVGSRGIHLLQSADDNPWPFTIQNGQPFWPTFPASGVCAPPQCRVASPTWGPFSVVGTTGDSIYHSLEVGVTKRVSHGLQFQSEYTYSKLIDDAVAISPSQSTTTYYQPVSLLDTRLDRASAPFDVRNNYRFNTIYNVPKVNSSNRFISGLANGWWTAVILSAENGYPFSASISSNRSHSRTGSSNPAGLDRPDWAPGRNPYNATHGVSSGCTEGTAPNTATIAPGTPLGTPSLFFDPCAFVLEPVGFEGNVGRDSLIGPGLLDLDYSLVKDTSVKWLGEAGKVEFRAEFFNILNHPNFAQPSGTTVFGGTSAAACPITGCAAGTENPVTGVGVIQSTATGTTATQSSGNSRQIQFGLKIVF